MNQKRAVLTVPVVGPEGEELAGISPARARRYLRDDRATVASKDPFTVRLLERRDSNMLPTQTLNRKGKMALRQTLPSTLIKNVSGGLVRISDLKADKEDEGLVLEPGVAIDLRQFFPMEKINASRDLRRALWPDSELDEEGNEREVAPTLITLTGEDDPNLDAATDGEVLRDRMEKEIKKPLVRSAGRVSPGRGGATPQVTVKNKDESLDAEVAERVNQDSYYDDRMKQVVEQEEAENDLAQAGGEVI